ncbi:MAG TPA: hypothetical protein VMM93_11540 [Vicinamibacterales bacterium]|nr:hypothetical protein [Vicinamibacterales bacterium]
MTEALVGVLLFLVITGAVFALVLPDIQLSQAGPVAVDLQQRARVASAALDADLRRAGAGLTSGAFAGSLARHFAAVVPRRLGPGSPDGPYDVRPDALSIIAAADGGHTVLADPLLADGVLSVAPGGACPQGRPFCGFGTGDLLMVLAADGIVDLVTVESLAASTGLVSPWQGARSRVYDAGSAVVGADVRTYVFDQARRQLRQTVQRSSSLALVDGVAEVRFTYFGDPRPPTEPRPPTGVANCLYDEAGAAVPLPVLPGDPVGLVELPLSLFGDGPWCGSGDFQYDADLLRVRRVAVRLRLEALVPGRQLRQSPHALSGVADFGLSTGVAPSNLGAGR